VTARHASAAFAVLVCVVLALVATGTARSAAITLKGVATIKPFDVTKNCGGSAVSKKLFRVRCTQFGTFSGQPSAAGASLGWTWDLAVGPNGSTTGHGTERATLILNFGAPGLLYLSLAGKQAPVGKGTPTRASALTKGTWTVTKGTAGFTGRNGKGTYTFKTARTGSRTVFSVAQLSLSGTLT
jgi:hypothetical protein